MIRKILIGLIAAGLSGCFGGGVTGISSVTGTFTLASVNGTNVPFTTKANVEIMTGSVNFFEGGTYSRVTNTRTSVNGQPVNSTTTETGTYSLLGNSISFRSNDGSPLKAATVEGRTLKLGDGELILAYIK